MAGTQSPKDGLSPELRKKLKDVESKVEGRTQIRRVKRLQELQDKLRRIPQDREVEKHREKSVFASGRDDNSLVSSSTSS